MKHVFPIKVFAVWQTNNKWHNVRLRQWPRRSARVGEANKVPDYVENHGLAALKSGYLRYRLSNSNSTYWVGAGLRSRLLDSAPTKYIFIKQNLSKLKYNSRPLFVSESHFARPHYGSHGRCSIKWYDMETKTLSATQERESDSLY